MSGTDHTESNPNAGGPERLEGDMGVSSERSHYEGIEGTGTVGSARGRTDGTMDTSGREEATQPPGTRKQPRSTDTEAEGDKPSIDRTVGEESPAPVRPHDFDPSRNPGHSHG